MKRSNIAVVLAAALAALALAPVWAGGGGEKKSDGTINLRFSWWGGEERNVIYQQICDRFEADNPGIKITREPGSWNDYFTKLATQVAGGGQPDIMQMHRNYVKMFSDNGIFLNLDDPSVKGIIDWTYIPQVAIDTGVVDGKNIMINIGLSTNGIFTNTAILKELGIPESRLENMSWETFEALCNEIAQKSKGKYYGYPDDSFGPNETTLSMYMRSRGHNLYKEDGSLEFTKEDLTAWLELFDRLRKSGGAPAATVSAEDQGVTFEQSLFVAGKQAMHINSCNRLEIYQNLMPSQPLILERSPSYKGITGENIGSANIAISAKSRYPKEAAKFLDYFVNTERSLELYLVQNGFPANTKMNEYVGSKLSPSMRLASEFMGVVNTAKNVTTLPAFPPPQNSQDILRLLGDESQAVAFGRKTIARAVDDFFAAAGRL
ncbi:putative ABC transporter substrate-binding protein YesO [Spirochaetia bacterium]|nr:putative ABC transporter substrate-binding protein YesO [Spirochaetia bacterium]